MTVLLPAALVTFRVTVYFPAFVYLCTGFLAVEVYLSPKFQRYDVDDPVLLSVNFTVNGTFPETGDAEKCSNNSGF